MYLIGQIVTSMVQMQMYMYIVVHVYHVPNMYMYILHYYMYATCMHTSVRVYSRNSYQDSAACN